MHAHESRPRPRSLGVGSGEGGRWVDAHNGLGTWTATAQRHGHPPVATSWASTSPLVGFHCRAGLWPSTQTRSGRPHEGVAAPKRETTWTATTHERGLPPVGKMDGQSCLMAAQRGRVWTSIVEGGGRLLAVHRGRKWTPHVGSGGRPSWPYLAVHIGRTWSPIVEGDWALIGRPSWAEVGA